MKKSIVVVLAIVSAVAYWNYSNNSQEYKTKLSDLSLENVEALAECETITGGTCWMSSYTWRCCEGGDWGCAPCD